MANHKSTENLIVSDDSVSSFVKVQPKKPVRKSLPSSESIESLFDSDDESHKNHQIRQVQPADRSTNKPVYQNAAAFDKHTENTIEPISVLDKTAMQNIQVQTAAEVHRTQKDTDVPIPLPRRKLMINNVNEQRSDTDSEVQTKNSSSFFSNSRQDTIIELQNENPHLSIRKLAPAVLPRNIKTTNADSFQQQTKNSSNEFEVIELSSSISSEYANSPKQLQNLKNKYNKNPTLSDHEFEAPTNLESNSEQVSSYYTETTITSNENAIMETSFHTSNEKEPSKIKPPSKPKRKTKITQLKPNDSPKQLILYEKIIGIYIHETSPLKFDYSIMSPMVRVSIYDVVSECLLPKSDPNRAAVQHFEPIELTFIQPLLSRNCSFKDSTFIECVWEELLLINEDINHLQTGNEIIFFEIISMMQIGQKDFMNLAFTDGWHHICWAFLRPGDGQTYSHIDQRIKLQLFVYQTNGFRKRQKFNMLEQWRMKRQKYPATLDVTVKGLIPKNNNETTMKQRPMHVLEEDTALEFIHSDQSSVDAGKKIVPLKYKLQSKQNIDFQDESFNYLLGRGRKLPGQSCKVPNEVHVKLHQARSKGSLVSKFSPSGKRLAFTTVPESQNQKHDILIVRVSGFQTETVLQGHTSVVYSLDWGAFEGEDCSYLLSVSSDRTAIVWCIHHSSAESVILKIFPHPCFVYVGVLLYEKKHSKDIFHVATGGRDGILRLWKSSSNMVTDLLQELRGHDNFITSIVSCKGSQHLYTSDWNGTIIEWNSHKNNLYEKARIVKSFHCNIRQLHLHHNEETIFVAFTTAVITSLNIRSGITLHTFDVSSSFGQKQISSTISPCGSLLLTTSADTIQGWNILTGHRTTSYAIPFHARTDQRNYISSIEYHPHTFLLSITVYGASVDAGIYILDYAKPRNPIHLDDKPITVKHEAHKKFLPQQDLGQIIQRIDDIFRLPQNRTDDLKSVSVSNIQSAHTYIIDNSKEDDFMIKDQQHISAESQSISLARSSTFTVSMPKVNQKTFSISEDRNRKQSDTFNIIEDRTDIDSDCTTASEEL